MLSHTRVFSTLALARLALISAAIVLGPFSLPAQITVDPVSVTAISGFRGTTTTVMGTGVGPWAMFRIHWRGDLDTPCAMDISMRDLPNTNWSETPRNEMNICGRPQLVGIAAPMAVGVDTDFGEVELIGEGLFIRGVAVCTNSQDNHRLKGLRIYAASVMTQAAAASSGADVVRLVQTLTTTRHSALPNCSLWHPAVYCPTAQIATGVAVHHSAREITGLALRCRAVRL